MPKHFTYLPRSHIVLFSHLQIMAFQDHKQTNRPLHLTFGIPQNHALSLSLHSLAVRCSSAFSSEIPAYTTYLLEFLVLEFFSLWDFFFVFLAVRHFPARSRTLGRQEPFTLSSLRISYRNIYTRGKERKNSQYGSS